MFVSPRLINFTVLSRSIIVESKQNLIISFKDRNRVRNEFIGLKLNDVIKLEREKCEQRNSGMDMSDLQVNIHLHK